MSTGIVFISTEEAAKMLGYSVHSVRDKARKKELPAHNIGRKWLFDPTELANFVTKRDPQDRLTI